MPLLVLRYYASVTTEWSAEQAGPEHAVIVNHIRHFEAAVMWEYTLNLVRNVAAETYKNSRDPV